MQKKPSDAENRKRQKETFEKANKLEQKTRKLDSFWLKENKEQQVKSTESSNERHENDSFDQPSTSAHHPTDHGDVTNSPGTSAGAEASDTSSPREVSSTSQQFSDDPALWGKISEELQQHFIIHGIKQNMRSLDFKISGR